jgi:hypothetical protein
MKYKVGDVVRIKTWEQMADEYEVDERGYLKIGFLQVMEREISENYPNRILTIDRITSRQLPHKSNYIMKETREWFYSDKMIEGLVIDEYKKRPKVSRFELIDFED